MQKVTYSEIFNSIQGEGPHVGVPQIWLRFAGCNLQCDGFGQDDPTDPSTYELPYKEISLDSIKRVEDLPVFEKGCDSSYTWSKNFKHLMKKETTFEVAERLVEIWKDTEYNNNCDYGLAFTGGEPLLKKNSKAIMEIVGFICVLTKWKWRPTITIETNGTQPPLDISSFERDNYSDLIYSVSPKLFNVSGELPKKAIKIKNLINLMEVNVHGYLKFVVSNTQACFDELEGIIESFLEHDDAPTWFDIRDRIYLMPVGATKEQQQESHIKDIADYCVKRNYFFCPRVHCDVYGNVIGT